MAEKTTTYEVWDGMGNHVLTTTDYDAAWAKKHELNDQDVWAKVHVHLTWPCARCGTQVSTSGGRDADCRNCGACYNGSGDQLRDDWRGNPSWRYGDCDDMTGFEIQHAGD